MLTILSTFGLAGYRGYAKLTGQPNRTFRMGIRLLSSIFTIVLVLAAIGAAYIFATGGH